jgi:hypothetical protein
VVKLQIKPLCTKIFKKNAKAYAKAYAKAKGDFPNCQK